MDPRLKDGVRAHPSALVAGALLHVAVATALVCLVLAAGRITPPSTLRVVLLALLSAGAAGGVALFVRRLRQPVLRTISSTDDYASNLLVVVFILTAAASLVSPGAAGVFFLATAALAIYAPFGKIRHCVLFFVTRARFGAFIGTRGVLVGRPHR
jgi:hypothetical protein